MIGAMLGVGSFACALACSVISARIHRRQREQIDALRGALRNYIEANAQLTRALTARIVEIHGDEPPDDSVVVLVVPSEHGHG